MTITESRPNLLANCARARRLSLMLMLWGLLAGRTPAQDYDLELMVQSGVGGFVSVDLRVGINNAGTVAFTGDDGGGSKAYIATQPGQITTVSFASNNRTYSGASINNTPIPKVASRDRVSGAPAFYFIRKWPSDGSVQPNLVGKSPTHFNSGLHFVDLNDNGIVAFSALVGGSTQMALMAGNTSPPKQIATYNGIISVHPQISNTNMIVIRDNLNRTILWPYPSGSPQVVASSITGGFSTTGTDPGISPDGTVVVFSGNRGSGEGLFASVSYSGGRQLIGVAGEGLDGLTDVVDTQRIGVNTAGAVSTGQVITIVFGGTLSGVSGVYAAEFTATEVSGAVQVSDLVIRPVAQLGDSIGGSTLSSFYLSDPISGSGWIALQAGFADGSSGVLRAARFNHVRLGVAGLPMNGITIEIALAGTTNWQTKAVTGSSGGYQLSNVSPGNYHVRASALYADPADGLNHQVVNYPNWDPTSIITVQANQPILVPDIIYPEPTIFQGGLFGGLSTWATMVDYFTEEPLTSSTTYPAADKAANRIPSFFCFPVPNSSTGLLGDGNPAGYTHAGTTIADHLPNAQICANWVTNQVEPLMMANWIDPKDVSKMSYFLVAHSMGNLIARAMVTSGFSPPILRVVSLDGTHGGSRWANVLPFQGIAEPPVNGIASNSGSVPVFTQPGWNAAFVDLDNTPPWLLYSCKSTLGTFGIVNPDASAWGFGRVYYNDFFGALVPSGAVMEWVSGARVSVDETHGSVHENPIRLMESAQYLVSGAVPAGDPSFTRSAGADPTAGLGGFSASVSAVPGGLSVQAVEFDTNTTVYVRANLAGTGAGFLLRDAGGAILNPIDIQADDMASGLVFEWREYSLPPTGTVSVEVTAGLSEAASLDFVSVFGNGRELLTDAAPGMLSPGGPVQILAHLDDGLGVTLVGTSPVFTATVTLPDGSTSALTLFDDGLHGDVAAGDGLFGETFTSTATSGRYSVRSRGRSTIGGDIVERNESAYFAVMPTLASFSGTPLESTPDANANLLFDSLDLDQTVAFTGNGSFKIVGELRDAAGQTISALTASFSNTLGAGSATVTFVVPSGDIAAHGVDGPWTLAGLTLYDLDAGALPSDVLSDLATLPYSVAAFEPPPAPTINWVIPDSGPLRGGIDIVLSGSGLLTTTSVMLGSRKAVFDVVDDTTLRITVPRLNPTFVAGPKPAGTPILVADLIVDISVTTPWTTTVLSDGYSYIPK